MKPLPLCHFFIFLAVMAVAMTGLSPRSAQGEKCSFIRYYLDSPQDLAFLRSHPELNIVSVGNKSSYVDIIAGEDAVTALGNSCAQFELLENKLDARFFSDTGRTVAQVVAFMDTLRMLYPHVVSQKWSLGQSHEGRDIWCFRMSDNPDVDQNRPAILFDALHHPGEWPSTELDIRLAEYFAQNYGTDPEITYLLDRREVYFVPIVNPDGRVYIEETGNSWNKKNRRDNGDGTFGVNLNRNYPFMWGVADPPEADSTWCDCYHGPYAGSEPETQAIMGLVNSHDFVTHQSYHTPGYVTFYPWAYTTDPTPDAAIYTHMGEMMTRLNGYEHLPVSGFSVFSGFIGDWSYGAQDEHEKIFAFTNEVAPRGGQTMEEELQLVLADNLWPAIYLMRVAGAYVIAGDPAVIGGDADGSLDPGETAGLSFTLTNKGVRKEASGLSVRISSDDPYIQLADAERDVGTIAAFSSTDFSTTPFTATVDSACPVGRTINLDITVIQQDGPLQCIVQYVVGGPVVLFSDDFESGTDGWALTGTWALTTWTSTSPPHSLTDSPDDDYMNADSTSATITQQITASNLSLSFWHAYETEASFDFAMVQVSLDGGPWTTLPSAKYTGSSGGWQHVELPLADYLRKPVQFRFRLESDDVTRNDGWYIDDVVLMGSELTNQTPPPPVLISPVPGDTVKNPVLTVANSTDPDGDGPLTYGFRVYGDSLCTNLVASVDGLAEGAGQTSWEVSSLPDSTYWWRAYAADSTERGLLGEKRMFEKSNPVAILIQRFEARTMGSRVHLEWELFADETVAGFNIYRREGHDGLEWIINEGGLIPAADRSFDDTDFEAGRNYFYALGVARPDGSEVRSPLVEVRTVPYEFSLGQNYPNPFNQGTTIKYSIPKPGHVDLRIYDAGGRLIKSLVNGQERAGEHIVTWKGQDEDGSSVASGIYFLRLDFDENVRTRKIVMLK